MGPLISEAAAWLHAATKQKVAPSQGFYLFFLFFSLAISSLKDTLNCFNPYVKRMWSPRYSVALELRS